MNGENKFCDHGQCCGLNVQAAAVVHLWTTHDGKPLQQPHHFALCVRHLNNCAENDLCDCENSTESTGLTITPREAVNAAYMFFLEGWIEKPIFEKIRDLFNAGMDWDDAEFQLAFKEMQDSLKQNDRKSVHV